MGRGDCRARIDASDLAAAQRCYAGLAGDAIDDDARLARSLAGIVEVWRLRPLEQLEAPKPTMDALRFFDSGRLALVGSGLVAGGVAGVVSSVTLQNGLSPPSLWWWPANIVATLVGAGLGGGASLVWGLTDDKASDGDVHLVRAALVLGTFHSALVPAGWMLAGTRPNPTTALPWAALSVAGMAGPVVGAFLFNAVAQTHESAGALGLTFGALGGTLFTIGVLGADVLRAEFLRDNPDAAAALPFWLWAAVDGSFVAGALLAPVFNLSPLDTWLIDGGAALGFLLGGALAVSVRAPTPALGWGAIGATTLVGAAAGYAVARFAPAVITLVEPARGPSTGPSAGPSAGLAPLVIPGIGPAATAVVGGALVMPLP